MTTSPTDATDVDAPRSRRATVILYAKWFFGAVALALLVVGVVRQWSKIVEGLAQIDLVTGILAVAFTLVALVCNMLSWKAVMSAVGSPVPLPAAVSIFFVGQLGKYIPGGVWSIAAQAELGRAYGIARGPSALAAITSMLIGMVTAAVVAVTGLLLSSSEGLATYWWLFVIAVVGLVVLAPPILGRLVNLALRLLRRPAHVDHLTWTGTIGGFVWSVVMWVSYGVQATLLLRAFGASGPGLFALAMGAYAAAWLIGFLIVIAPAGLGAREGVLLLLLGTATAPAAALSLAVVSRAIMTLGDVVLAGIGALVASRRRRALAREEATSQSSGPSTRLSR
ncbi:lysylphosphatidylglycerol synthase transmembrane domain-containing protein [Frondihabitans sp. 762G35]|uniref:lysylphosphatidylglycerol synthase transmembrane domain-containing protein n=1 Tax=Frondihabitans sp. 762G35 TaxID=1446794 RepID=UPI000E706A08|nr:lysylphosphatidylglycerol synthase domain-containing protein [Frondihabitans sp. 762G35]